MLLRMLLSFQAFLDCDDTILLTASSKSLREYLVVAEYASYICNFRAKVQPFLNNKETKTRKIALLKGMLSILAVALEPSEPLWAPSLRGACAAS